LDSIRSITCYHVNGGIALYLEAAPLAMVGVILYNTYIQRYGKSVRILDLHDKSKSKRQKLNIE
jgi:hypothetical protein